jgi:hypothetical protein
MNVNKLRALALSMHTKYFSSVMQELEYVNRQKNNLLSGGGIKKPRVIHHIRHLSPPPPPLVTIGF